MNSHTQDLPLASIRDEGTAVVRQPQPRSVADLLSLVVERGISADNVAAFTQLVQLHREEVKANAERAFAEGFIELQKALPTIPGSRVVPGRNQGEVRFKYANFDDIDAIVRPLCLQHGFSYSFRETAIESGRVTVTMTLQHAGGHSREIPYSVRIGSGPPGASESQADVSGHSYAKRGAIESGLSLRIVGERDDARMEGGPITVEQADELARRVAETNSDRAAFLKLAGSPDFKGIMSSKFDMLDQLLTRKEKAR